MQEKVLRGINFQSFTAPSKPFFQSLIILKLEDTIYFNISVFVHQPLNKLSPTCFYNYFTPSTSVNRFGTCQTTRGDLFISLRRTTLYELKQSNTLSLTCGIHCHYFYSLLVPSHFSVETEILSHRLVCLIYEDNLVLHSCF